MFVSRTELGYWKTGESGMNRLLETERISSTENAPAKDSRTVELGARLDPMPGFAPGT